MKERNVNKEVSEILTDMSVSEDDEKERHEENAWQVLATRLYIPIRACGWCGTRTRKTTISMTITQTTKNLEMNVTSDLKRQPCAVMRGGFSLVSGSSLLPLYLLDGRLAQGQPESIKDSSFEDRRHENINIWFSGSDTLAPNNRITQTKSSRFERSGLQASN